MRPDALTAAILSADSLTDEQRVAMLRLSMNGHAPPMPATPNVAEPERETTRAPKPWTSKPRGFRYAPRTQMHREWRERRAEVGMTQVEFAEALGITPSVLRALEGGYRCRTSGPYQVRRDEAEQAYWTWLDAKTRPECALDMA